MGNHFTIRKILRGGLHPQRGFTMMEIMIVVVIVAILFAVTLPSLRATNDNNRLRASVREVMSLMKYARSEAVFNSRTTEVFLDTEKHEFWLDLRTPDKKTGRYNPKKLKSTMEHKRELNPKVRFKAVNALDENILRKGIIAFDFFPDGTASPGLITLENNRDHRYTIEVFKPTGMVELNTGDLESVQDKNDAQSYPLPDNYNDGYSASGGGR